MFAVVASNAEATTQTNGLLVLCYSSIGLKELVEIH